MKIGMVFNSHRISVNNYYEKIFFPLKMEVIKIFLIETM